MGKINILINWAEEHPYKLAAILFLFHLFVSLFMYIVSCSPFLAGMHNGQGLWNFAIDSFGYDQRAIRGSLMLHAGDFSAWWAGDTTSVVQYPHVRLIALMYFVFSPSPIAFAPVNALTWVATVFSVYALARLVMPGHRNVAAVGAMVFFLMPTYLLQTTQLLKDPLFTFGISFILFVLVRLLNGMFSWKVISFGLLAYFLCIVIRPYMQIPLAFMIYAVFTIMLLKNPEYRKQIILAASVFFVLLYADLNEARSPKGHVAASLDYSAAISNKAASSGKSGASSGNSRPSFEGSDSPDNESSKALMSLYDLSTYFDYLATYFQRLRTGLYSYEAGSHIDEDVVFENWIGASAYLPRAFLVGLLSPFPSEWLEPAQSAGKGSRLLAGVEMAFLYVIFTGFVVFMFCKTPTLRVRVFLLMFSLAFLVLLGMVVPNEGAIYRMRYPYLLPIILGGVFGCWSIYVRGQQGIFDNRGGRLESEKR